MLILVSRLCIGSCMESIQFSFLLFVSLMWRAALIYIFAKRFKRTASSVISLQILL